MQENVTGNWAGYRFFSRIDGDFDPFLWTNPGIMQQHALRFDCFKAAAGQGGMRCTERNQFLIDRC